jgi:hypothetical protein
MTIIAGIMACHAFTSNVTGHTVVFTQLMVTGSYYEMGTVFSRLLAFIVGAGLQKVALMIFG